MSEPVPLCPTLRHMHSALSALLRIFIVNQVLAATCGASILVRRVPFLMLRQRTLADCYSRELSTHAAFQFTNEAGRRGFEDRRPLGSATSRLARSWVNCEEVKGMRIRGSSNWRMPLAVQVIVLLCVPAGALASIGTRQRAISLTRNRVGQGILTAERHGTIL